MIYRLDFTRGQPATFEVLTPDQAAAAAKQQDQQKQLGWLALVVVGVVLLLRK